MGTALDFIVYTNDDVDLAEAHAAIDRALLEIERLEAELSEWRESSDIGRVNHSEGTWINVSPETVNVIEKALWVARESKGTFDITFHSMGDLWKFGTAQSAKPEPPRPDEVRHHRSLVDYRRVEIDAKNGRVRIPKGRKIGLGGIAKGYIVDRAVAILKAAGLRSFMVQAGGDLYAAGRKPDGSHWTAGIRDPRGPEGDSFATLELEDHAFSTAGDYARAYVFNSKRYHHIIDPRTGYPATASRSVTIYAPDALTADMIDDAVFILGPEKGLALVNGLDGVGAVIVDAHNRVWVSPLLEGKAIIHKPPTDGL
jgi:thiamine biosynthesis lipoprotein